jgi:hypothetical protein
VGGFRAKDADRERYVEVIETAYVDGQLGDQDRELRISRALTAETLDELDGLTRDLQNQPAPVVVRRPAPRVVEEPPAEAPPKPVQWPAPPKTGLPVKVVWFLVAGVFGLSMMAIAAPSPGPMDAMPVEGYESTVPWESGVDQSYELSESTVRTVLRRYRARFQTSEAQRVTLFTYQAQAQVPAGPTRPSSQVWTWDGDAWNRAAGREAEPVTGVVDLSALDVKALFRNVVVATTGLGAADAEVQRIELRPSADGRGRVTIHVRDGSGGRAVLETTLKGSRVREVPFEG